MARRTRGRCATRARRSAKSRGSARSRLARARRRRPPPAVLLTNDEALPRLRNVVVALITRTIRSIDTEVELGPAHGMPIDCAVSLDNLTTVPQTLLTEPITQLDPIRIDELCRALARSTGCA